MLNKKLAHKTVFSTRTYQYRIYDDLSEPFKKVKMVRKLYYNYGLKYLYQHYGIGHIKQKLPSGRGKQYLIKDINYLGLKSEVCSCNRLSLKHNLINSVQTCKSTPECNRIIGQLIDARLKFQTCWNLVSFRSVLDKLRLLLTMQVFNTQFKDVHSCESIIIRLISAIITSI